MSNVDRYNGFTPSRHIGGGVIRANEYEIADDYNTGIYSGDAVKLADTGILQLASAGDTNLVGIFAGVQWIADDGSVKFDKRWPASTSIKAGTKAKALVFDDPQIAFAVQCGGTTAFAQTMVGNNADLVATHAGNDATGISGQELNITTGIGATTAQFRILGLIPRPDNDYGAKAKVEVMLLETIMRPAGTAGI